MIDNNKINIISRAVKTKQIKPYLQPIVDYNNKIKGFEVLSRWVKSENDIILPYEFIEDMKSNRKLLDDWTVSIIDQLNDFFGQKYHLNMDLHINIYSESLSLKVVKKLLSLHEHINVVIEILEDDIICDEAEFLIKLEFLLKHSVKLAIDDFGCGLNDTKRLARYKFDIMKIDRKFISLIDTDINQLNKIKKIISLSKKLDLTVIAEGVETREQANLLNYIGVKLYQGFLYYKPMSLENINSLKW